MSEANKEHVHQFFEQTWNRHDPEAVDQFMASDYHTHTLLPGMSPDVSGLKQWMGIVINAFPDLKWSIDDTVCEGDTVAVRWTATGTHRAEFMGIPATGKQIRVRGMSEERLEGGKIVESWGQWDAFGLLQQLGVIPEQA